MLTDNGSEFTAAALREFLSAPGVVHTRTRPAPPWTNGRIERLFRSFKECHRRFSRVFVSRRQLRRFCSNFVEYHNHCRPHAAYWGLTPAEVNCDAVAIAPATRVELFDGMLLAHRFG